MQDFAQQSNGDTIGADGYDKKVYAFVKPNIVYQNADKNYVQYDSENKLWRLWVIPLNILYLAYLSSYYYNQPFH